MPKYCICIPSKGRPKADTFVLLGTYYPELPTFVFVEPADVESYSSICPFPIVQLAESGRGIGYSRHCIMSWANAQGYEYVYMIDDDINAILVKQEWHKYKKVGRTNFFEEAVQVAERENISNLVCMHSFNARFCDQEFTTNSCAAGFVLLKVADVIAAGNFDSTRRLYEDAELHVRMLCNGYRVVRWNNYAYSTPPDTQKQPKEGGCVEEYKQYLEASQQSLIEQYPGVFSVMQKNGMPKLRTSWKTANALFGCCKEELSHNTTSSGGHCGTNDGRQEGEGNKQTR